jgi:hypothetical protein
MNSLTPTDAPRKLVMSPLEAGEDAQCVESGVLEERT